MNHREFVLAEMRCTRARLQVAILDVDSIGLALNCNVITPDMAVEFLWGSDAWDYFGLDKKALVDVLEAAE